MLLSTERTQRVRSQVCARVARTTVKLMRSSMAKKAVQLLSSGAREARAAVSHSRNSTTESLRRRDHALSTRSRPRRLRLPQVVVEDQIGSEQRVGVQEGINVRG